MDLPIPVSPMRTRRVRLPSSKTAMTEDALSAAARVAAVKAAGRGYDAPTQTSASGTTRDFVFERRGGGGLLTVRVDVSAVPLSDAKPPPAPKVATEPDIPSMVPYRMEMTGREVDVDTAWSAKKDIRGIRTFDRTTFSQLEYNALTPSKDLMEMQRVANAERRAALEAARPENLTLRRVLADVYDGVIGAWEDLSRSTPDSPRGVWAVWRKRNRLRGLGLALAAFAVGGLVIESAY